MVLAVALAAIVSACSTAGEPMLQTRFERPVLPETARQTCDNPAGLPDRDLTEREVASLWGRDRSALLACEQRRKAAVDAVDASPTKESR